MDVSGKVRDLTSAPSPMIYRSRGATPPKIRAQHQLMRAVPYAADKWAQLHRNGHAYAHTLSLQCGNRMGAVPYPVHPPTSPTSPAIHRLKRRARLA
jgi:hypothetical protein